jgi:hypothetical protein
MNVEKLQKQLDKMDEELRKFVIAKHYEKILKGKNGVRKGDRPREFYSMIGKLSAEKRWGKKDNSLETI